MNTYALVLVVVVIIIATVALVALRNKGKQLEEEKRIRKILEIRSIVSEASGDIRKYVQWCDTIIASPKRDWKETAEEAFKRFQELMYKHPEFAFFYINEMKEPGYDVSRKFPLWKWKDKEGSFWEFVPSDEIIDPTSFSKEWKEQISQDGTWGKTEQFALSQFELIWSIRSKMSSYLDNI